MDIFKKIKKNLKFIDLSEYSDYSNCIYLSFISENNVKLFDCKTGNYIETIKF